LVAIVPQTPSDPLPFFAVVHALQGAVQELPQQTPSTQYPDKHCVAVAHGTPLY